jgi:hypothetical protein
VIDDDGDGIVFGTGAFDARVEDEPGAIVEGDRCVRSGRSEGLALTELREAELIDGAVFDEEADGDAGAILRVVGGVVGAVGGIGDVASGVDLRCDVVGDRLVFNLLEGDDVGSV